MKSDFSVAVGGREKPLGRMAKGFHGRVAAVKPMRSSLSAEELERRLIEMGFVEGASVEVLHEGLFRDPIAVRVGGTTIAMRRREAMSVLVQ